MSKKGRQPTTYTSAQQFWNRSVAQTAADPSQWFYTAKRLKRAADLIWDAVTMDLQKLLSRAMFTEPWPETDLTPPISISPVYMLLAGLALENLVKGIIIGQKPERVRTDQLDSWGGSGHKLRKLCEHARIQLEQDEDELVQRLQVFVLWGGRYPVPLDFSDHWPQSLPTGDEGVLTYINGNDPVVFERLFARLATEVQHQSADHKLRVEAEVEAEKDRRRRHILNALATNGIDRGDGVLIAETQEPLTPEEKALDGRTGLAICCACGAQLELSIRRRFAQCRCGTVYEATRTYVGSTPSIAIESFPNQAASTETESTS